MRQPQIERVIMASFNGETEAFKPGNVSVYADGHDMTVADFQLSARAATPWICHPDLGLGQRLLQAVNATREAVGCNTNLGMLLLYTPLAMAAEQDFDDLAGLRSQLQQVLASLTQADADDLFQAISLASPGGLGKVDKYDVTERPMCTVLEAMQLASSRDIVALQYLNNYAQVFEQGFSTIKGFVKSWNSVKWATVVCYLEFLSNFPDSHIQRKYGNETAEQVKNRSGTIYSEFIASNNPESAIGLLQGFDKELKYKKINPGTSADLAATSLLVYNLAHINE